MLERAQDKWRIGLERASGFWHNIKLENGWSIDIERVISKFIAYRFQNK